MQVDVVRAADREVAAAQRHLVLPAVPLRWRWTHLLAEEDGPGGAVVRLRARLGTGQHGERMDCFYCLSVWLLERATSDAQPAPAADWVVDSRDLDVADFDRDRPPGHVAR